MHELGKNWPLWARWIRKAGAPSQSLSNAPAQPEFDEPRPLGVTQLPRSALRWVGPAGRIALRPFDWGADADLVCTWQQETYTANFAGFRFTPEFGAAFRQDLRRAALDSEHGLFVLDDGKACGFLWVVICQNSWTNERYGYVNNLFVVGARRGEHLGEELMRHAHDWFRNRRIRRLRLTVTTQNVAACRLYEKMGYGITRWEMEHDLGE